MIWLASFIILFVVRYKPSMNMQKTVQNSVQTRSLFHQVVSKKRFCFIGHCLEAKRHCFTIRANSNTKEVTNEKD